MPQHVAKIIELIDEGILEFDRFAPPIPPTPPTDCRRADGRSLPQGWLPGQPLPAEVLR